MLSTCLESQKPASWGDTYTTGKKKFLNAVNTITKEGLVATSILLTSNGTNALVKTTGFCLGGVVPQFIQKAISYSPSILIEKIALSTLGTPFTTVAIAPILEEIECRFLFQEVLLRQLPKRILENLAPEYSYLVDSKLAKVARIASSTALFMLLHMNVFENINVRGFCSTNYGFDLIALGLTTSYLQERTGGTTASIATHMLNNFMGSLRLVHISNTWFLELR